jgi:hypothetical protein
MATLKRYRVLRHHLGDRQEGDTIKQHMFEPSETRDLEPTQGGILVARGVLEEIGAADGPSPPATPAAGKKPAIGKKPRGKGAAPANKAEGAAPDNKAASGAPEGASGVVEGAAAGTTETPAAQGAQ